MKITLLAAGQNLQAPNGKTHIIQLCHREAVEDGVWGDEGEKWVVTLFRRNVIGSRSRYYSKKKKYPLPNYKFGGLKQAEAYYKKKFVEFGMTEVPLPPLNSSVGGGK